MNTGFKIRKQISSLIINHPAYSSAREAIMQLVIETLEGMAPDIEFLIGPSRSGKTEILRSLEREFPSRRENGRLVCPVLFVYLNSGTSPKDLPASVIEALGQPVPRGKLKDLFKHMLNLLKLSGVRVVLFDEASHLVDTGTKIPPRQASDWFKDLHTQARSVSIVLTGVPRLQKLLESNEQLRNRARRPILLSPYRWDITEERHAFAGCVKSFLSEFQKEGCPLEMPINLTIRHLYASSAGHIGLLAGFLEEVARLLDTPAPLTKEIFQSACDRVNLPGNGMVRPFEIDEISDEQLMYILVSELARNDLTLPVDTAQMELVQARSRVTMQTVV